MPELQEEFRFKGTSEHTVDDKGRVFIPSKMKDILGPRFTLSKSFDKCLEIHTDEGWRYKIADMAKNRETTISNLQRFVGANAEDVVFDKQGRILIPLRLREYAGIKKEVVIVGAITHAEIWDKEEWQKMESECANPDKAKKEMDEMYKRVNAQANV